jgi:multidrug efflux pump subunit AcrA (membrane-fusion protein)
MSNRTRTVGMTGGLAVGVVAVGLLALNSIYTTASAKSVVRTATVQRGTVQSTVTATGNVAAATTLALNFQSSGVLTSVDVKPGDQVAPGQQLAKIDDAQAQASLASAQAALTAAQANLANVQQPVTAAIAAQNQASLVSSNQQVVSAQTSLTDAEQAASLNAVGYQNAVNQAQAQRTRDVNQQNTDCTVTPNPTACNQDNAAVAKDNDTVTNALQQQATGQFKDQQSIRQATNSLASAQAALASTQASNNAKGVSTPASLAQAQSQVTQAQASLLTAQKNEADTTLKSPGLATVAAVNGVVGQTISGGGASSSASGSSGSGASSSSSGSSSSAFVTLTDLSSLNVVAGFAEADAGRIQVGQAANVSLNALPNQQITGQVSNVQVTSTVVSNVVTYNVTVSLTNPPAGAKPGMTANVNVVVAQQDNVLHVPTADVSTRGGTSTVIVSQNGKQVTQPVVVGMVGDQSTEITSGLTEGQTIVEPTVTITTGSGGSTVTTPRAGGGGGLGGGGLGGGGFGGGGG